jgi:FIST N domain
VSSIEFESRPGCVGIGSYLTNFSGATRNIGFSQPAGVTAEHEQMHSQPITWNPRAGWTPVKAEPAIVSLVFYFGTREMLASGARYSELRKMFPLAHILGCSTGGQINNSDVSDDEIVAAAIGFDSTRLRLVHQDIADAQQSCSCGEAIGLALSQEDLAGVFVLSDGIPR